MTIMCKAPKRWGTLNPPCNSSAHWRVSNSVWQMDVCGSHLARCVEMFTSPPLTDEVATVTNLRRPQSLAPSQLDEHCHGGEGES
jgi:ribosomal protein L37AE/L43A